MLPCLALLALATGPLVGEEPVVAVDAWPSTMERDGSFVLHLELVPRAPLPRGTRLRVALDVWQEEFVVTDLELEPAAETLGVGERVVMSAPLEVPAAVDLRPGDPIGVLVGLIAPDGSVHPPLGHADEEDGLAEIAAVDACAFRGEAGAAELEALVTAAGELRRTGDVGGAWATLVDALRTASDDPTKERLRDELLAVGRFEPAPLRADEERIVRSRIEGEKRRFFRLIAGRLYDRGMLHASLRLLEAAGGTLAEDADAAVAEALNEAERVKHDIDDLKEELVTRRSAEEQAGVDALIAEHGLTAKLAKETERRIERGAYAVALELLRQLRKSDDDAVEAAAWERIPAVEELEIARTPDDQAAEVRATLEHPAWARTASVRSHAFVFIGPRKLVEGIPDDSKLAFDLSYVFLTDLFGRLPNPDGDRVTVYFKELWDFGGGVGGGKIIDIGNADPFPSRPRRVDNGLLYHELTHCIDDTRPIFAGFREGLANLGAAYAFEALDQDGDALHSFDSNLEQFRRYFLERDLEYWRIQNYGPSAGFFLHFVDAYAKRGRADHDWAPLRRFFREYREAAIRDGREPHVARSLAHHLRRAFGPAVFDDLVEFGFPLTETDRRPVSLEVTAFEDAEPDRFTGAHASHPDSPLPRDLVQRELVQALKRDAERAAEFKRALGIVEEWKTIGPFFVKQGQAEAHVFDPEYRVDFSESVTALRATRDAKTSLEWRDPTPGRDPDERPDVLLLPSGWLRFEYQPYGQRNAVIYALTHVTVAETCDALAHVRADDDFALFVNGERVVDYADRGRNGGSSLDWRGPTRNFLPDGMRAPVRLRAGRNRVLVKIGNDYGRAALSLAFSRPDGTTLEFSADAGEPDPDPPAAEEPVWKRVALLDHRSFKRKTKATVGGFRAERKLVAGTNDEGGVGWRPFTVRPGFPKDSPSNLTWLAPNLTENLTDVRVELVLEAETRAPKLVLTIQGEGGTDGLSGWNLVLLPRGNDAVVARVERYDRLVLETETVALPADAEEHRVVLELFDERLTAAIDGVTLFDRAPVHAIGGAHRVGLATWGRSPRVRSLELSRARPPSR